MKKRNATDPKADRAGGEGPDKPGEIIFTCVKQARVKQNKKLTCGKRNQISPVS